MGLLLVRKMKTSVTTMARLMHICVQHMRLCNEG